MAKLPVIFIHCGHLYSASSSGTTQRCYNTSRLNNAVLVVDVAGYT